MKRTAGFTVIELVVVIAFLALASGLLLYQKANVQAAQRDASRKIAINAMYFNLEEVFFEKNNYYPETIDSKILRAMDPQLFTDPNGVKLGETGSNYRYDSIDCESGKCKAYSLRSSMEREADYVKTNRNK